MLMPALDFKALRITDLDSSPVSEIVFYRRNDLITHMCAHAHKHTFCTYNHLKIQRIIFFQIQ